MQEMTGTIQGPKHIQRGDKKKDLKKEIILIIILAFEFILFITMVV